MKFEAVPATLAGFSVGTTEIVILGGLALLVAAVLAGIERELAVLLATCCGVFAVLMS